MNFDESVFHKIDSSIEKIKNDLAEKTKLLEFKIENELNDLNKYQIRLDQIRNRLLKQIDQIFNQIINIIIQVHFVYESIETI
jgi:hypothetical protein